MQQLSINQRLNFLLKHFNISARAFSEMIGETPTKTQNYVGVRNSMPGADYLEKILLHFDSINPLWLLTGKSEPFLPGVAEPEVNYQTSKKNKGNIIGSIAGDAHFTTLSDCEKAHARLRTENEQLRAHLVDKEKLIRLLEVSQPKPKP